MKPTKTTTQLRNSINRSPLQRGFPLIALALAWLALSRTAQAQDGSVGDGTSTAEGLGALAGLTTGGENTANGFDALSTNTTGSGNTANGATALFSNKIGINNTANGFNALFHNTADNNTATGAGALFSNTTGTQNTANGLETLSNNTTGNSNTATGFQALLNNTTGTQNAATGAGALLHNGNGNFNTADGVSALTSNTMGSANTAGGTNALLNNTTGNNNTANGVNTLLNNTMGNNNIALGTSAGFNLTTGSNNIDIGNSGVAGEAKKIRIGTVGTQIATFIAGIHGVAVTGSAVVVSTGGQLGVAPSSERFKDEIKPMDKASEAILALKPVTFRYKHELDPDGIPQFGLVAEQVEKVSPDLVARDADGKVYTVRYEAVNTMLLNEFLKEHHTVQELKSIAAKQEALIAKQQKQIEGLSATVQKVSDRLELSKPAPQLVADNQ